MNSFDAAVRQPTPTGNGIDVIDVAKQDVLEQGKRENRQAAYSLIDPYDFSIWLAVQLRTQLHPPTEPFTTAHEMVALDLERRAEVGSKKYGTRLKTHNGRNPDFDAYQELLDFINYACQARLEGQ